MDEVVIAGAVRTPIGRFLSAYKNYRAPDLGAIVIKEVLKRTGLRPEDVEEVLMGNVITAGLYQNPARQAALYAGLPPTVAATTVNKVCGSGMKSVTLAASEIKAGDFSVIVAGGQECMTGAPFLVDRIRFGHKMGDLTVKDAMIVDGLWDIYNDFHMGMTGEIVAEEFSLTREEIDRYAYRSHMRAHRATEEGHFKKEIVPVLIDKREETYLEKDEGIRPDTSLEKLARLKPVFKKDGVITAGNASQLSDGAAAMLVTTKKKAEELGVEPQVRIVDYVTSGVEPERVMCAPIPGVEMILKRLGMEIDDFDLVEHNEAFSSASIAIQRYFDIPEEKFNISGGAVALGHPIGCSGARILTTLIYNLHRLKKDMGLATICLGGGNAVTMAVERI
ncbi:acetyl-CoA acetyltransferase [Thermoplasmatales archaeon ex4484_36]|nr:MAG: acetyl-CoA acetyltransferase [Thermoplasmatales archaeon ex4484_36]RLF56457.1 MAG: acetyl-CoA C-acyltransferase [Thermoplasmata archaeon]RLF74332.1 MAG: acetyl-CoA C-acyltransferase [Thermoplasmata archaeon]HDD60737.1 thiolase family protein [Euryarchaeota archaeon]